MLQHVDSSRIFRELASLRIACNPKQNSKMLWRCLHDSVMRLRALLPADLVMTDGDTSRIALERLRLHLDKWDGVYGLSAKSGEAQDSNWLTQEVQSLVEQFTPVELPENKTPAKTQGSENSDQLVSPTKIADCLGIPPNAKKKRDALRKRLESWRKNNLEGGWIEATERKPREPRYYYPLDKVLPLIVDLKPSS